MMTTPVKVKRKYARTRIPTPRWDAWQSTTMPQRFLPPLDQANGYTVVRIHPACREVFMDLLSLLRAYGEWRARQQEPKQIDAAWTTWGVWTRRLAGAVRRVLDAKPPTIPGVPGEMLSLVEDHTNGHH
jgi:hypothetical protein